METKNIYISIIIPVYNVEQYIVECLDSITNQTYQKNVECILVDDCSTDNSREVINEYISKYDGLIKFKVIYFKENQRQGIARNVGVNSADGNYVLFVDSDDILCKNCLEEMMNMLNQYPDTDYVIAGMADFQGVPYFYPNSYPSYSQNKRWLIYRSLFPESEIPPGPVNKLIKKELITNNNIVFPERIIYEDVQFSFLLGIYANSVSFCKKVTYLYRTNREGSTITTISKNEDYGYWSRLTLLNNIINRLSNEHYNIQLRALFCRYVLYFRITPFNILKKYRKEQYNIRKKFLLNSITHFNIPVFIFSCVPINIMHFLLVNKIIYKIVNK